MKVKINQTAVFLIFWFFTLIGSNLYIGSSMFSIRNLLYPVVFILIYMLRKTGMNKIQKTLFIPTAVLFGYATIMLIINGIKDIEAIKDYFYLSFIPVLFVVIMLLANENWEEFFRKTKIFALFLLYFLFAVTLFEFFTNIHLPVHAHNTYHIPSAFFTNANDLSVIVIQLFTLITVFTKRSDPKWQYITAFLVTTFIVFLTLSRLALATYIVVSVFIILSKEFSWKQLAINILVIGLSLTYLSFDLPDARSSSTVVDRSKTRINSMTEINLEEFEEENDSTLVQVEGKDTIISSTHVRLDIYRIPLRHPGKFIFGYGLNSDKKVITKYRTLPYHIVNSHSFFIQIIFYFGWIGLAILASFFLILTAYGLVHFKSMPLLVVASLAQALLLNIPSSVMRFPLVWIPFFIIIAFYTNKKSWRID